MPDGARAAFLATLRSPWTLLLAIVLVVGPAILALAWLRIGASIAGDPLDIAISAMTGPAAFPSLWVSVVLVLMLAVGAFAPTLTPLATLAGRVGALSVLVLGTWSLPTALLVLPALGPGALAPAALASGVALLEVLAMVVLVSLLAELGAARAPLYGAGLLLLGFQVVPLAGHGLIALLANDGMLPSGLWQARLGFFTPFAAADQLQATLFPRSMMMFVDPMDVEDHALLFSPWLWLAVMFAWIVIPLGILRAATSGAPRDEDEPQTA